MCARRRAFNVAAARDWSSLPPEFYTQIAADHQSKRGRCSMRCGLRAWSRSVPAGAYYILAKRRHICQGKTAAEKARGLLAATGVAAVAGSAFFRPGRGEELLRFCFAKKDDELDEACARLRRLKTACQEICDEAICFCVRLRRTDSRFSLLTFLVFLSLAGAPVLRAQTSLDGVWQGYDGEWRHTSSQLVALAEATPADKFAWLARSRRALHERSLHAHRDG